MLDADVAEVVSPFYLNLMGTNALAYGADFIVDVARVGRALDAADVIQLLQADWRPRVMGAWFALMHDEPEVSEAVLSSLETSLGSLTSPPLAVAAVILAGSGALGALAGYAARDATNGWGVCAFIAAAAEHLGGSIGCSTTETDRNDFAALLAFGERLRDVP